MTNIFESAGKPPAQEQRVFCCLNEMSRKAKDVMAAWTKTIFEDQYTPEEVRIATAIVESVKLDPYIPNACATCKDMIARGAL